MYRNFVAPLPRSDETASGFLTKAKISELNIEPHPRFSRGFLLPSFIIDKETP